MAKYQVQMISADEFERDALGAFGKPKIAFEGDFERCMQYWTQYASGLQDDGGECSNQNFSTARFWRIVEVSGDGGEDEAAAAVSVPTPSQDKKAATPSRVAPSSAHRAR